MFALLYNLRTTDSSHGYTSVS